jgi:hypothetical protein
MTYKELKDQLDNLNEEQLEMDVTIYDSEEDEFFGCYAPQLSINKEDDTLDDNHPYLTIKDK